MRVVGLFTRATREVVVGGPMTDKAILQFDWSHPSELPPPSGPFGTVTFELFDNPDCLPPPLFTSDPHDVSLPAGPLFPPVTVEVESEAFHPTRRGKYFWRAHYSGSPDGSFFPAQTRCVEPPAHPEFDPNEVTVVRMIIPFVEGRATVASRPGLFIVGRVVVTGPSLEPQPTGTVTFKLFAPEDPDCSGPALVTTADVPLSEDEQPTAKSRIFRPTRVGAYRWMFDYSGDENYIPASPCGGHGGISVVSEHKPEETVTAAELGLPVRHEESHDTRGRVIFADVVDLLPLPSEIPDET